MSPPITSDKLLELLADAGIIPDGCAEFSLTAKPGELIDLTFRLYGDDRLLRIPWKNLDVCESIRTVVKDRVSLDG